MLAFRVEHDDGDGPYCSNRDDSRLNGLAYRLQYAHSADKKHPSFFTIDGTTMDHCCACSSAKQLRKWFRGFISPLNALGYSLAIYKPNPANYLFDDYQCCFVQSDAELIKKLKLSSIWRFK